MVSRLQATASRLSEVGGPRSPNSLSKPSSSPPSVTNREIKLTPYPTSLIWNTLWDALNIPGLKGQSSGRTSKQRQSHQSPSMGSNPSAKMRIGKIFLEQRWNDVSLSWCLDLIPRKARGFDILILQAIGGGCWFGILGLLRSKVIVPTLQTTNQKHQSTFTIHYGSSVTLIFGAIKDQDIGYIFNACCWRSKNISFEEHSEKAKDSYTESGEVSEKPQRRDPSRSLS